MSSETYIRRKVHSTKTHVILAAPGLEADPLEGWTLICDEHAGVVHFESRKQAQEWFSHPEEWCPTCQENKK